MIKGDRRGWFESPPLATGGLPARAAVESVNAVWAGLETRPQLDPAGLGLTGTPAPDRPLGPVLVSAEALLRDGPLDRHRRAARARQGLASGLLNTAAQLGTALGLAVLVAVAAAPSTQVDGFRAAFAADAALAAVATASVVADGLRPQESRRLKRSDAV